MLRQFTIVTHGGAGSSSALRDGCQKAAEQGLALLRQGQPLLEAAVEATRFMEDDGRFNAGWGSILRLDGKTQEMDAAVMDSEGRLGCVVAISRVQNPVLVAKAVSETPHVALAGSGAVRFARRAGFPPFTKVAPRAMERFQEWRKLLQQRKPLPSSQWSAESLKQWWNFTRPFAELFATDTVGAVVSDGQGRFAVALSTGGGGPALAGRVGDTPFIGCGFFAGTHGAVAATGLGEEIIRRMAARAVYGWMAAGMHPQGACERGVGLFPHELPVGFIAVSPKGHGIASNREMAAGLVVADA